MAAEGLPPARWGGKLLLRWTDGTVRIGQRSRRSGVAVQRCLAANQLLRAPHELSAEALPEPAIRVVQGGEVGGRGAIQLA